MRFAVSLLLPTILAGCVTTHGWAKTRYPVVYGTIKNDGNVDILDELGLNVRFTAQLHVSRVVSGQIPSQDLTIRYIAHTHLPEDVELRLKLRAADDDIYLVCRDGGRGYICD